MLLKLFSDFEFHLFKKIISNDQNGCSYSFYYALWNVSAVRLHHAVLMCLKSLNLETVSSLELCGIFLHVVIIYHRSLISLVIFWCVLKLWLECVFMACIFRAVNECYFQWFHIQHLTNVGMGECNPVPRRWLWTKQPWTQWVSLTEKCKESLVIQGYEWLLWTDSFLLFNDILYCVLTENCLGDKLLSYPN